jgi:crossover junction endonuclease MUS81
MAWVAQCIIPKQKPIEIMVGTIIERKEISDLVSSLYGTRYSEQRLRLSQCGIPQVLFLVEGEITNVPNCPADTIRMAMMETRVQLGFQVVQTKHLVDTVRVLKGLHRRIVQRTFPNAFWSSQKDNVVICPSSSTQTNSSARKENCVPSFVRDHDAAGKHRNGRRRVSSLLEMVFDTAPIPPFGAQRFITYSELKAKVELDREQATRRIGAVTLAMLKQIPSLSEKKCTAIGVLYPTMNRLLEALCYEPYDEHDDTTSIPKKRAVTNPAKLIQTIPVGRNLTVGPKSGSEV